MLELYRHKMDDITLYSLIQVPHKYTKESCTHLRHLLFHLKTWEVHIHSIQNLLIFPHAFHLGLPTFKMWSPSYHRIKPCIHHGNYHLILHPLLNINYNVFKILSSLSIIGLSEVEFISLSIIVLDHSKVYLAIPCTLTADWKHLGTILLLLLSSLSSLSNFTITSYVF